MSKTERPPLRRLKTLLTSGNLWLYILSVLEENNSIYPYILDSKIEEKFNFKPNKIMIYIVIYKLEAEGLLETKMDGRRKIMKITKNGSETLKEAREYMKKLGERL